MNYSDLKKEDILLSFNLNDKGCEFIYMYGAFNCDYLIFKSHDDVMSELKKAYPNEPPLDFTQKKFIVKNSGKKVLCYINRIHENNPDIFVYGDDNIAFTVECFKPIER